MSRDYHKGKKIQCYIPEDLAAALDYNAKKYNTSKTSIIIDALYSYIGPAASDSIDKKMEEIRMECKNSDGAKRVFKNKG